ncbi:MAG: hypothetical protein RR942_15895 [Romboutsia sp.]
MINVVSKNMLWEVRVNKEDSELFCESGEPINDVTEFHDKIVTSDNEWDIAFYKDLVAFKNSCERTTHIYSKRYWNYRMRDSFKKLDKRIFK